jgi:beta-galactosidase
MPFKAGELSAVGYMKGKKVAFSKLVTAESAAKLSISAIPLSITSDVELFDISVRDKNGQIVTGAVNAITLKVEGGARLMGIDNGDLNYTGSFKTDTRNAFQGRLLVTLQKVSPGNEFRIIATSPGLDAGTLVRK